MHCQVHLFKSSLISSSVLLLKSVNFGKVLLFDKLLKLLPDEEPDELEELGELCEPLFDKPEFELEVFVLVVASVGAGAGVSTTGASVACPTTSTGTSAGALTLSTGIAFLTDASVVDATDLFSSAYIIIKSLLISL